MFYLYYSVDNKEVTGYLQTDTPQPPPAVLVTQEEYENAVGPVMPTKTPEPTEVEVLQAKVKALTESNKFLEDCLIEMAGVVYQ